MSEKILQASAAKINITPPPEWLPFYNKRNGLGGGPDSYFGSILDDIYTKALMIDNGEERIVFVVYDALALPVNTPELREIAAEAAGTSVKNVLITVTHDHNAVPCNTSDFKINDEYSLSRITEYLEVFKSSTKEAVEDCVKKLQPAKIGYGSGLSYVNVNRHAICENGANTIAGFERHRYSDRELIVLRIDALDGTPISFLFNYGCHASLLANNKPDGKYTQISGDLAGAACRKVEALWDNKPIVIHTCGSGGDQNAVLIARVYDVFPDGSSVMHDFGPAGPICLDFMADKLAADVNKVAESITEFKSYTPLWASKRAVTCSKDALPLNARVRQDFTFEFELFMLGDIAVATTNGEMYSAIGRRVKDESPFRKTIYMNVPDTAVGYIKDDSGNGIGEKVIKENIFAMMSEYSQGMKGTVKDLRKN